MEILDAFVEYVNVCEYVTGCNVVCGCLHAHNSLCVFTLAWCDACVRGTEPEEGFWSVTVYFFSCSYLPLYLSVCLDVCLFALITVFTLTLEVHCESGLLKFDELVWNVLSLSCVDFVDVGLVYILFYFKMCFSIPSGSSVSVTTLDNVFLMLFGFHTFAFADLICVLYFPCTRPFVSVAFGLFFFCTHLHLLFFSVSFISEGCHLAWRNPYMLSLISEVSQQCYSNDDNDSSNNNNNYTSSSSVADAIENTVLDVFYYLSVL